MIIIRASDVINQCPRSSDDVTATTTYDAANANDGNIRLDVSLRSDNRNNAVIADNA